MALVKCKECDREVSDQAKVCPHCGVDSPSLIEPSTFSKTRDALLGAGVLLALGYAGVSYISGEDETTKADRAIAEQTELQKYQLCKKTLTCWSEKHASTARRLCYTPIEKLAKNNHEWTDTWLDAKFSHSKWIDQEKGLIAYLGDKIKFQNGFGGWQYYTYECAIDPRTATLISVHANPGRL